MIWFIFWNSLSNHNFYIFWYHIPKSLALNTLPTVYRSELLKFSLLNLGTSDIVRILSFEYFFHYLSE